MSLKSKVINRSSTSVRLLLTAALLISYFALRGHAATVNAVSCSLTDVQNAINAAANGDTVVIPSGSCAWTSGIAFTKGISIKGSGGGRIIATSVTTTAVAIGTGSRTLSVTSTRVDGALSISAGQTLRLSELGFRQNFMQGSVTSYSAGTLVMNITSSGGTCGTAGPTNTMNSNCKRWLISTMPSTVLVNNSQGALFTVTENTATHTVISDIKVASGSGASNVLYLRRAANGRAILVHDCWFEGGANGVVIDGNTSRGVAWNNSFDSSPFGTSSMLAYRMKDGDGSSMGSSWTTPSTMGMADTNGESNFYLENNDFHALGDGVMDLDDNSRTVIRYNFLNNSSGGTHGADTSTYGSRHFEFYNNIGSFQPYTDDTTPNLNWWVFVRGGTFVVFNNVLPALVSQDKGTKSDVLMTVMNLQRNAGPNPCWGSGTAGGALRPSPRQVGAGYVTGNGTDGSGRSHDSVTYVGDIEPIYMWNNKRTSSGAAAPLSNVNVNDYGGTACSNPDTSLNYLVSGREYFNTTGTAKPGYTPYTYPHPLRLGVPPSPPQNLIVR